eukprot:scaffold12609_cov17-Prasinocladus_malaysianus.AAC.2
MHRNKRGIDSVGCNGRDGQDSKDTMGSGETRKIGQDEIGGGRGRAGMMELSKRGMACNETEWN